MKEQSSRPNERTSCVKQPLFSLALFYVAGILCAELLRLPLWALLAACLLLATFAMVCVRQRFPLLCALLAFSGLCNAALHRDLLSPHDLRKILGDEPRLVTVRGQLLDTPTLRVYEHQQQAVWRTQGRLEVTAIRPNKGEWQPAWGHVAVTSPGALTNRCSGQRVEVTGVIAQPPLPAAEGTFNYRRYLELDEIYYLLRTESEGDWQVIGTPVTAPFADRFARWGRQALALGLPHEDDSLRLEWALALGWKTALTEAACEPFVQAATYHIFAVDGLRMAIVFGIFFCVLRALGLPRGISGVILLPVIWFYAALTGWPASAIRACIMLTVILVGWVLRRPSNPLNSLFAAALLILLWKPQQLYQAGFQLSFFVVLCLILIIPPLFALLARLTASDPLLPPSLSFRLPRWLAVPTEYLGDVSITSFAAWIGSVPLVAYYFNIVTPVSTPANILAVPLCVLVLISNFTSLALASWWPGAAVLFNHAGWFGMECIRISSQWFARWPAAYWYSSAPSVFATCLYYVVLLGLFTGWLLRSAFRKIKIGAVTVAVFVWLFLVWQQATTTRLTVLPASGGTVVHCDAPGRARDVLIDTGPTNSASFLLKNFLRAQGVNELPTLVLTHGDTRHTGGTEPIVDLFHVSKVYTPPISFRSSPYRRLLRRLDNQPGLLCSAFPNITIGNWTVLHPDKEDRFPRADDGCMVLSGQTGTTKILLLSDLGAAGQTALCDRYPELHADIVVAGLPTAGEPLNEALLNVLHPKLIVIGDSQFPVAERAGLKLRERLGQRRVPVVYTSDAGGVTLDLRKNGWQLRTTRGLSLSSTD
jgi:competence protein ComEC